MATKLKTSILPNKILNPALKAYAEDDVGTLAKKTLEVFKKHSTLAMYKPSAVTCQKESNGAIKFEVTFDGKDADGLTQHIKKAIMNVI